MSKYVNLVFVTHVGNPSKKQYVFQLPLNEEADKRALLIGRTAQGDVEVIAANRNFIVPSSVAKTIVAGCGGYYPPARIVGRMKINSEVVTTKTYDYFGTSSGAVE